MAPRKKFDEQSIIDAVKQLENTGKAVTANALRTIVGSGRPSAIWDMYQQLLANGSLVLAVSEQQEVAVVESYELPSEVKEELDHGLNAFKALVIKCNDIANHTVEKRLNAAIEKAKKAELESIKKAEEAEKQAELAFNEAEEKQEELDELQSTIEELKSKISELEKEKLLSDTLIASLESDVSGYKLSCESLEKNESKLQETIAIKDKKITELETKVDFIDGLSKDTHKNLNEAREEKAEAVKALAKTEGKVEALEAQLSQLEERIEAKDETINQLKNKKSALITGEVKKDPASHETKNGGGEVKIKWLVNGVSILSLSENDDPELEQIEVVIASSEHEYIRSMVIDDAIIEDIKMRHQNQAPKIKVRK